MEKKYIESDMAVQVIQDAVKRYPDSYYNGLVVAKNLIFNLPAADVVSRDEGIKMGAELAAMHGATPEQQQLEEAYLKGFAYGMARRNVRPVVRGKWVEARGIWCTPGGDPVWECSECGKGRHVYGIEHGSYGADVANGQWVACPNCGAVMEEADDTPGSRRV